MVRGRGDGGSWGLPGRFLIVFLYKWSGEGGREDPEFSQIIFLLFFYINGKGKVGGGILQKWRQAWQKLWKKVMTTYMNCARGNVGGRILVSPYSFSYWFFFLSTWTLPQVAKYSAGLPGHFLIVFLNNGQGKEGWRILTSPMSCSYCFSL